jgi:amino acid transporter
MDQALNCGGGTIGSGIFVVPGIAAGIMGPLSLIAWVIVAASATCVMLSLAWLGPLFGGRGTFYRIFSSVFGGKASSFLVMLYLAAGIFGTATIAAGIGQYLSYFGVGALLAAELVIIAAFCGINIAGVSLSGTAENLLTALKVIPLVIIALVLVPAIRPGNLAPTIPVTAAGLLSTILIVYWPFTGFEISAIPVDEVRDPALVSRSLILVMALVSALYLLLNLSLIGAAGSSALASSPAPIASAVALLMGNAGTLVAVIGIIAMLSAINAYLLGSSRVLHHLASAYHVPRFRDLNRRGTPALAIVLIGSASAATLLLSNQFATLAVLSVAATLVPYIGFCAAAALRVQGALRKAVACAGAASSALILIFSLFW